MEKRSEKLVTWLFETKAVRVCEEDKPFWYTSGTIGPYYINTHFLYGSESKANKLLKLIDAQKSNKLECTEKIYQEVEANYVSDRIFKGLIDEMCSYIKENIDIEKVDCISGGERRDWFFSIIIAVRFDKPHITLFKDNGAVLYYRGKTEETFDVQGKKVLHIADLVTEASSYERAWIPALRGLGAEMGWSVVVVDRDQGGSDLLRSFNVKPFSMVTVNKGLFDRAAAMGMINTEQNSMVQYFIDDPKGSMRKFLVNHPEFLENSLNADEKTRDRAKMCIEKDIYGLKDVIV